MSFAMSFVQRLDTEAQLTSQPSSKPPDSWIHADEQMSDESEASDTGDHRSESTSNSAKKPRNCSACLSCRRQKTRCEYLDEDGPCKLCVKYNRECVKAPPRRRRQKTTVRIADLEQKIQSLTDALVEKAPIAKEPEPSPLRDGPSLRPAGLWMGSINMSPFETRPEDEEPAPRTQRDADVVDKGLIDKLTAYAAFERFRTKMCQFFTFLTVPPDISAEQYRRRKPLLFSVMVLTGVAAIRPELPPKLAEDLMKTFGDCVMYRGDRSLELVQCLTLYVCFYSRTLQRKDLNFYQYIHVACTMALELGLGRRASKAGPGAFKVPANEQLEARRAWLGCYYMSANAAISLRHPAFIRWSPYIEECLEVLSTHPQAVPTDRDACDYIRITRILQDAATIFSMDDPGSVISLKDPKTQYQLGALERQLQQWQKDAEHDLSNPLSRSVYATTNLYIHEIALHSEHDIDKFRSPPLLDEVTESLEDLDIAPVRIDALCSCLESAHELFNILFELDIDTLRCLPNLFFVRTGYAAVILKSLSEVFESNAGGNTRSHAIDVKFDKSINKSIGVLTEAGKDGKSNIANSFVAVLKKIKQMRAGGKYATVPSRQAGPDTVPVDASSTAVDQPAAIPDTAPIYPTSSGAGQFNMYNYTQQQPLPAEFNFNDIDTNMFDISAFQTFDPNLSLYDFGNMYPTDISSMSANN